MSLRHVPHFVRNFFAVTTDHHAVCEESQTWKVKVKRRCVGFFQVQTMKECKQSRSWEKKQNHIMPPLHSGGGGDGMTTFLGSASGMLRRQIQVLAAAALHRKPVILSVLNALQLYRHDCSKGTIKIALGIVATPRPSSYFGDPILSDM